MTTNFKNSVEVNFFEGVPQEEGDEVEVADEEPEGHQGRPPHPRHLARQSTPRHISRFLPKLLGIL